MAQFEGTIKEFTKFIGAYARIKVMHIAAKLKKQTGKCEDCGIGNSLEAAHLKGKERPLLIANILSEYIEDDIIKIDLNEFEERFIEAHLPIESTIRVLCKACHRQYDRIVKDAGQQEKRLSIPEEGLIIENLIKNQMNKSKAISLASGKLTRITSSNTIFSNINAAKDVWWLEPSNQKFQENLYIILNNNRSNKLHILLLPANKINEPEAIFIQRNDSVRQNCSKIYIEASDIKFSDKDRFDFTPFLVEEIAY